MRQNSKGNFPVDQNDRSASSARLMSSGLQFSLLYFMSGVGVGRDRYGPFEVRGTPGPAAPPAAEDEEEEEEEEEEEADVR